MEDIRKYKLADYIDSFGDGIHGTPNYDENGEYYFINGNNLKNGKIEITSNTLKISSDEYKRIKRNLSDNTLLVSINGTLGNIAFYNNEKIALGKSACFLNLNKCACRPFIRYVLESKEFKTYMNRVAGQSTIKNVSPTQVSEYEFFAPSYSDQARIAKVLSTIDREITINREINRNLEELAKQIYDYWFVQFDFPNEEGKPYKSSGGKMVWNETLKREIPADWEVKKLGEVCNFRNGINYDKKVIGNKTYKIVNVRNISASSLFLNQNEFDIISLKSNQADNYLVSENSILIARSGCPGATRIIMNVDTNVIFCGFIICMENFHSDYKLYFAYCLKALENTSATTTGGSILQNVSQDTLKRISVIIPPNDIITAYNEKTLAIFKSQLSIQKEIEELSKLRDNLLPLLMNGQVTLNSCLSAD